jgi:hypothetical protein
VGVGKFLLPRRLVLRHRCQQLSLAHSDMAFIYSVETSWRRQVLLNAHSKCVGSCSMLIQNMARTALFYHVGAYSNTSSLHDAKRAAPTIFLDAHCTDYCRICLEQL